MKRSDVGNGAVNSAKVADSSLSREDFKAGQLPAGPRGSKGDTGPTGPPGTNAANAQNADKLDGLDSSQFQRAGLVQAGAADETEDGLRVHHSMGRAGAYHHRRRRRSRRHGEDRQQRVAEHPGSSTATPGSAASVAVTGVESILVWSADRTRSWLVICARDNLLIKCHGVANRVG